MLTDAFASWNVQVVNEGNAPTFVRGNSASHIDVTAAAPEVIGGGVRWELSEEENLSDHKNVFITLGKGDKEGNNAMDQPTKGKWKAGLRDRPKFLENIRRRVSVRGARDSASALIEAIRGACKDTLRHVPQYNKRQSKYWWTAEIASLRSLCTAARRKLGRRRLLATEAEMEELAGDCRRKKKDLRVAIAKSKESCWRKLISEVDADTWGRAYKIVCRRIGARQPVMGQHEQMEWAKKFFPAAEEPTWGSIGCGPHRVPPVTAEEVAAAAARVATGKAPGPSGIPAEAAKWTVEAAPEWVARVYTRMFKESSFPEEWGAGRLVLIPKSTATGEVAYRPLCLLETAGKVFEQVLLTRLRAALQRGHDLSERQYGFRPGRSTHTALRAIEEVVMGIRRRPYARRPVCAMVTLDIKNAFNTASWSRIMAELERRRLPKYLVGAVGAYLRGRKVIVGERTMTMTCGVPQGSVLGPTLWNIMYDPVLELAVPEGVTLLGYADDLALVGVGRDREQLETKLDDALKLITSWMKEAELSLAAHKTEAVILVGSRRMRAIRVRVDGHEVVDKEALKYLGVWIGREYRFGVHIARTTKKVENTVRRLSRLMPNRGGPGEASRRLLCSVADAQVLYAAQVWIDALRHRKYREAVDRVQRRLALRITSAYRTVSGPAVMVVAGIFPLHLLAKERAKTANGGITKTEAREETIQAWQRLWEEESRGAWTRRLLPQIRPWYERGHGQVNHWITQLLTGHGGYGEYLHRFKRRAAPTCFECGTVDHAEHTFFQCKRWTKERSDARRSLNLELSADNVVGVMLKGPEQWAVVDTMARSILQRKNREDSLRTQPL